MFWFSIVGGGVLFLLILGSNLFIRKSVNEEKPQFKDMDQVYASFDKEDLLEEEDDHLHLEIPK